MALQSLVNLSFIIVTIFFIFVNAGVVDNAGLSHSVNIPEVDPGLVHTRSKRGTSGSRLTYAERLDFLSAHNNFRRNVSPAAANMRFLIWNEELAAMAQEWADACVWEHGQPARDPKPFSAIGQNLEYTTASSRTGTGSTTAWHDEVSDYTYADKSCSAVCGHYTQVVWANSYALGCAAAKCASLSGSGATNAIYTVCNYGPAGNYVSQFPYKEGAACSDCPQGTTCENQLCVNSTSKCSGKTCLNGGSLDAASCECDCPSAYNGDVCDVSGSSDDGGGDKGGGGGDSGVGGHPASRNVAGTIIVMLVINFIG